MKWKRGGISVNSILKKIDLKKSKKIETLLKVENDIIYDIKLTNSKVTILTANKVFSCNVSQGVLKELDITSKNISNISIDTTGVSYVYKEILDKQNTIEFLNNKYKVIGTYKFNDTVRDFVYFNSLAYVNQNKEINIYNRWGMHIKRYKSDNIITETIVFNSGKNMAIIYSNKIVVIGI